MEKEEKWVSMEDICKHLDCSRDTVKDDSHARASRL